MIIAIRLMRHQTDCFLCHPEMCAIPGEDGVHPCPVSSRSLPETEPIFTRDGVHLCQRPSRSPAGIEPMPEALPQ